MRSIQGCFHNNTSGHIANVCRTGSGAAEAAATSRPWWGFSSAVAAADYSTHIIYVCIYVHARVALLNGVSAQSMVIPRGPTATTS